IALLNIAASWLVSPVLGAITAYLIFYVIRKVFLKKPEDAAGIEKKFIWPLVVTACLIAFAHGSNDVSNAIGPLYAVYSIYGFTNVGPFGLKTGLLILGGIGIVIGLATWGYKVIETVGTKITELTPTRAFSAGFATAFIVLSNSFVGLPVSTTQILVGSVIGVGLAGGLASVNFSVVKTIIKSWLITVPVAALISMILYIPLSWIFI
ncbi:MAG: inorganic phosphate transporter, partial [Methanosarcinales archaeon]|nr:inorganic phosphate transporter [Methanosarcinales archaeon]